MGARTSKHKGDMAIVVKIAAPRLVSPSHHRRSLPGVSVEVQRARASYTRSGLVLPGRFCSPCFDSDKQKG